MTDSEITSFDDEKIQSAFFLRAISWFPVDSLSSQRLETSQPGASR